MLNKIIDTLDDIHTRLFGTMDEPTTLSCVLFFAFIFGSVAFCVAGMAYSLMG